MLPTSNHHRHAQKGSYTLFSSNTKHIRYLSHLSYFPKQHPDTKASQAICYNMNQIEKDLHLNVGVQWNVLFGAVCWSVWKNQNALNLCWSKHIIQSILPKPVQQGDVRQLLYWEGPHPGLVKLNTGDGVDIGTRLGPASGLLHVKHGNRLLGYCLNDGVLDVLKVKLWGVVNNF